MKITGFDINGFGLFHDKGIEELSPGLNLFLGNNEAGKTTLLHFFRQMFFGFASGNTSESKYPPLNGGQHGGRLYLEMEGQEPVTLFREPGTHGGKVRVVEDNTGKAGEKQALDQLLGGVTKDLYNNIYAFGLNELQTFSSLTGDDLKSALYGASLGTGVAALPQAVKSLETSRGELFKQRGKNTRIHRLLKELKATEDKIAQAAQEARGYEELAVKWQKDLDQISELEEKQRELDTGRAFTRRTLDLLDDWFEYSQAREALKTFPEFAPDFPKDGPADLAALHEKRDEREAEIQKLARELSQTQSQADSILVEHPVLEAGRAIEKLSQGLVAHQDTQKKVQELESDVRSLSASIDADVDGIGAGFDREKVRAIDRGLFTHKEVARFKEKLDQAQTALNLANHDLEQKQKEHDLAEQEVQATKNAWEAFGEPCKTWTDHDLSALQRGRDRFAQATTQLADETRKMTFRQQALKSLLGGISPDWDFKELRAFGEPSLARESLEPLEFRLEAAQRTLGETQSRLEGAREHENQARLQLEQAEKLYRSMPEPTVENLAKWSAKSNAIRVLRRLNQETESTLNQIAHHQERAEPLEADLSLLEKQRTFSAEVWVFLVCAFFLGAAAGAFSWLFGLEKLELIAPMTGGFVLFAVCGLVLAKIKAGRKRAAIEELQSRLESVLGHQEAARQALLENQEKIRAKTPPLGLGLETDQADPDELKLALDHAESQQDTDRIRLEERTRAKKERDGARERLELAARQAGRTQNDRDQAKKLLQDALAKWVRGLEGLGLDPASDPKKAAQLINRIEKAQASLQKFDDNQKVVSLKEKEIQSYLNLARRAGALDSPPEGGPAEAIAPVDRFFDHAGSIEEQLRQKTAARALWRAAEVKLEQAEREREQARQVQDSCQGDVRDINAQWQTWSQSQGLPADLLPETANQALNKIDATYKQLVALDVKNQQLAAQKQRAWDFHQKVNDCLEQLQEEKIDADSVAAAVTGLYERLGQNRKNDSARQGLLDQVKDRQKQIQGKEEAIEAVSQKIAALWKRAGADSEEQFLNLCEQFFDKQGLETRKLQAQNSLKKISGESTMPPLKARLAHASRPDLEQRLREMDRGLEKTAEAISVLYPKAAEKKARMDQLANSGDLARLGLEKEGLEEQIRVSSKQWAASSLALFLLEEARRRFEEKKQPRVILDAGRFFKQITAGRYKGLRAPLGENRDRVLALLANNEPRDLGELSRGCAEQLYLALRMGYIVNFSKNSQRLPVIMDDILVNFDPHRAAAAADAVVGLAQTHQVLYFTCHPRVARQFSEKGAPCRVFEVEGGTLSPTSLSP